MPSPAPKTDKWTARENKCKPEMHLIVSGIVQVKNTNGSPRLAEAGSQGRSPQVLTLDLSTETGNGPGADILCWKPVEYHKPVRADQYASVDIHWGGKSIATCKVLDDDEAFQHLVKLTQAANAKFKQKPKAAPPAKPKAVGPAKPKTAAPPKAKTTAAPKRKVGLAKPKRAATPKRKAATSSKRKAPTPPKRTTAASKRKTVAPPKRKTKAYSPRVGRAKGRRTSSASKKKR